MIFLDLGNLLVHLRADVSQYERMMNLAEARLKSLGNKMTTMGRSLTLRVTAPIMAMLAASSKAFASFDDAMTKSVAIMKGVTVGLRKHMESLAVSISRRSVTAAKELAKAYFYLASAGLTVAQSIAALPVVEKFAVAGAFDMALATDLLTDAQSALGLTVKDSQKNMENMLRVSNALIGANSLANATTQQFSEALTSEAGPAMKSYRIELESGVAVLAAYADQGIKAHHAGSVFSRFLRLMTKGFKDNEAVWKRFKIDIYDAAGELKPLYEIIGDLSNVLDKMSTKQRVATLAMLGFQARSQQTILPLLGLQERIKEYNELLLQMSGITERIYKFQLTSFASQMKILWNNIVAAGIGIGRVLSPSILKMNAFIIAATRGWDSLKDSVKGTIIVMALLVAALGPGLWIIGLIIKSFGTFLTVMRVTMTALTAAIGFLLTPLALLLGQLLLIVSVAYAFRAAWSANLYDIQNHFAWFFNKIGIGYEWLKGIVWKYALWWLRVWVDMYKEGEIGFIKFIQDLAGLWAGFKAWMKRMSEGIVEFWTAGTFHQAMSDFKQAWDEAGVAWAEAFVKGFEGAEDPVERFLAKVRDSLEVTKLYLRAFKTSVGESLENLLGAVKEQFGRDADAIIKLIKDKMQGLKSVGEDLGIPGLDVLMAEYESLKKRMAELQGELAGARDGGVKFTGFKESWTAMSRSLTSDNKIQKDILGESKIQTGELRSIKNNTKNSNTLGD